MARTATRSSVATIIMGIAGAIAAVLVLGILLVVLGANQSNVLVDLVLDVGRFFATPFAGLFPQDDPESDIAINWGIAAVVYLLVGALLARLARR